MESRRYAVFDVDPLCMQNHVYFGSIQEEMDNGGREALLHTLLHFDLSKIELRTVPKTQALLEQKERTLNPLKKWWLNRLEEGCTTRHSSGWDTVIRRSDLHKDYRDHCEAIGVKHPLDGSLFGTELRKMVPGVKDKRPWMVRTNEYGAPEKSRDWCYVIPSLRECRDAWDAAMQQPRKWLDDDEDDSSAEKSADGGDL